MKYVEIYERLKRLEDKLPEHSCADIRFVRGLAFGRGCRKLTYSELLPQMVQKIAPLAITERLKA